MGCRLAFNRPKERLLLGSQSATCHEVAQPAGQSASSPQPRVLDRSESDSETFQLLQCHEQVHVAPPFLSLRGGCELGSDAMLPEQSVGKLHSGGDSDEKLGQSVAKGGGGTVAQSISESEEEDSWGQMIARNLRRKDEVFEPIPLLGEEDPAVIRARTREIDEALMGACEDGNADAAKKLLDAGADARFVDPDEFNRTPLHMAAGRGQSAETVRLLLAAGADPNAEDSVACRPLHLAAETLDSGAAPHFCRNILFLNDGSRHLSDVISALVKGGAECNARNSLGIEFPREMSLPLRVICSKTETCS